MKEMRDFLKAQISKMAGAIYFRSGMWYATTYTVNLVLFAQEITELQTHVKS